MTCAFTKPTVVPTASAWIGTSFWRPVVTRTSGGGSAGGSARLQALPKAIASMASVAANPREALEQCMKIYPVRLSAEVVRDAPIHAEPALVNVVSFMARSGRGGAR